jgi:hypothetical protein
MYKRLSIFLVVFLLSCTAPAIRFESEHTSTLYASIVIEIVPQEGTSPDREALVRLKTQLRRYKICNNVGIIVRSPVTEGTMPVWDSNQIRVFEKRHRDLKDTDLDDRHLVVYISYVKGNYLQGDLDGVAGLQYGDTSICMFVEHFRTASEGAVLIHEFGHLIDIARDREGPPGNPDRLNHCNNSNCVMFWTIKDSSGRMDEECRQEILDLIKAR